MSFTRQMQPKGLGHAVWCARDIIGDEPFAVILPDVIVDSQPGALKQLAEVYAEVGGNVIGVEAGAGERDPQIRHRRSHRGPRGQPHPHEGDGREARRAATAPSNLSISGRYILQPEIFDILETQPARRGRRDPADRRHGPADEADQRVHRGRIRGRDPRLRRQDRPAARQCGAGAEARRTWARRRARRSPRCSRTSVA
jgi:hypothetical protein